MELKISVLMFLSINYEAVIEQCAKIQRSEEIEFGEFAIQAKQWNLDSNESVISLFYHAPGSALIYEVYSIEF